MMAAFTEANVDTILSSCKTNLAKLAEALGNYFDRGYRLEVGEANVWSETKAFPDLNGLGLLTLIQVESQGLAVLVPESLPLSGWSTHSNPSERAQLDMLSMELSAGLIPPELEADRFRSLVVANLSEAVDSMAPPSWAITCELLVFEGDGVSELPVARVFVVGPLAEPNFELPEAIAAPSFQGGTPAIPWGEISAPADPLGRLRHLPVSVSVRLAEKKIPLSQLLGITPGMLITFNKSCDDLLDLYVNNSRYCRGEAVKIGENFGLKINQVGVKEETPQKVIDA